VELKLEELLPSSMLQSSPPTLVFPAQVIWHILILTQPQKTALKGHCCEPQQLPLPCARSSTCSAVCLDRRQQRRLLLPMGCPPGEGRVLLQPTQCKGGLHQCLPQAELVWLCILFQRSRRPQSDSSWPRGLEVPNSWQLPGGEHLKTSW